MHLMAASNAQPFLNAVPCSSTTYLHPACHLLDILLSAAALTRFSMVYSFQSGIPVPILPHHKRVSPQVHGQQHWGQFQLQELPQIPRRSAGGRCWGWGQGRSQPLAEGRSPPWSQDTDEHRARCSCQRWAVAQPPHTGRHCHQCTGLRSAPSFSCGWSEAQGNSIKIRHKFLEFSQSNIIIKEYQQARGKGRIFLAQFLEDTYTAHIEHNITWK